MKSGGGVDCCDAGEMLAGDETALKKRLQRAVALRDASRSACSADDGATTVAVTECAEQRKAACGWRATRSETGGSCYADSVGHRQAHHAMRNCGTIILYNVCFRASLVESASVNGSHAARSHRTPPVYSVMNKSQRMR